MREIRQRESMRESRKKKYEKIVKESKKKHDKIENI